MTGGAGGHRNDSGFAGTPPHRQPNGGSCTCSASIKDGERMVVDHSRCPLHSHQPASWPADSRNATYRSEG